MRLAALLLAAALCVPVAVRAATDTPPPRTAPLSTLEYVAELDALIGATRAIDARSTKREITVILLRVPLVWQVAGPARTFDISTHGLRSALALWTKPADAAARDRVLDLLGLWRAEAAAATPAAGNLTQTRASLIEILSRREFREVRDPGWRARWLQWILRSLGDIPTSQIPTLSTLAIYGLIVVTVIVLAIWVVRKVSRDVTAEIARVSAPPSLREWPRWLTDAERAASERRWRDAVHLSYWCAVTFLEAHDAWRPDPTRTPREYLHLLPPGSTSRPPFVALTSRFELVWYGNARADQAMADEALGHLRTLGCHSA